MYYEFGNYENKTRKEVKKIIGCMKCWCKKMIKTRTEEKVWNSGMK